MLRIAIAIEQLRDKAPLLRRSDESLKDRIVALRTSLAEARTRKALTKEALDAIPVWQLGSRQAGVFSESIAFFSEKIASETAELLLLERQQQARR